MKFSSCVLEYNESGIDKATNETNGGERDQRHQRRETALFRPPARQDTEQAHKADIQQIATRCGRLLKGKPGVGIKRKTDRHTEAQEIRQRLMGMKGVDADSKNYPVDQCVDHAYGGVLDEVMPHKQ